MIFFAVQEKRYSHPNMQNAREEKSAKRGSVTGALKKSAFAPRWTESTGRASAAENHTQVRPALSSQLVIWPQSTSLCTAGGQWVVTSMGGDKQSRGGGGVTFPGGSILTGDGG